jgi:hypothetical protein
MARINGYKPLSDWYVLGGICFVMLFVGFMASQILDPIPRTVMEIMTEMTRCHRETQQSCAIMVMPVESQAEVYLLYSQHVK